MTAKKKNPQRPAKYDPPLEDRLMVQALICFGHRQARIAARLGITEKTLCKHFSREIANAKMEMDATAISALYKGIKGGESWAVQFYLRTRGRAFGWSERINIMVDSKRDPFDGLDLTQLSPAKMRQFTDLLELAGAQLSPADEETMQDITPARLTSDAEA